MYDLFVALNYKNKKTHLKFFYLKKITKPTTTHPSKKKSNEIFIKKNKTHCLNLKKINNQKIKTGCNYLSQVQIPPKGLSFNSFEIVLFSLLC